MKLVRALPLVALGLLAASSSAQVVVNEVLYDPAGPDAGLERIELGNVGAQPVSLAGWSLAVCYPGTLQDNRTYWPFPSYVSVPPGGAVTIHWLEAGVDAPGEYYTGLTSQFICVTPAKELSNTMGSVALYDTTNCSLFQSVQNIQDFVQWGGTTYHELHARVAGIWPAAGAVPLVPEGQTIAYDGDGDAPEDWWQDASPTIGLSNVSPGIALTAEFGTGCAGTAGIPTLDSIGGPPALGNQSFQVRLQNALPSAPAVVGLASGTASLPAFGCLIEIDVTTLLLQLGPQTTDASGEALFNLPIPDDFFLLGITFSMQGAVVDPGSPSGIVAFSTGLDASI